MKFLLDTQALLWWLSDDERLGREARDHIADPSNDVLVSVVSLWEIAVKVRIGKLVVDIMAVDRAIISEGFDRLAITSAHLATLTTLPVHHRDPFDHLLIAQAIGEASIFVSDDRTAPLYPVQVLRCTGPLNTLP